ncbi:MAG TPA: oxidoreductase, partial [Candidatus Dormibacteraeota bacterium]|nr:oxidoreductase [Candidatus Dormibacteraeota bacterium]
MTAKRFSLFVPLWFLFTTTAEAHWWKVQTRGLDTNLRAVSAAYARDRNGIEFPVVWTSGSNGVILKSLDQGESWQRLRVKDGEALDFRGIVAFSEKTAYVMSSGDGDKSRIYKTTDGGETWKLQYSDDRKEFFLDAIRCFPEKRCLALGDPIDGKFLLLKTTDGEHWNPLPTDNMPAALPGEGAFAASNSCLLFSGENIFFGTGGPRARVFHSTNGGLSWTVARTPLVEGNASSGIFALAGNESDRMIVVGGDYKDPNYSERVAATSRDNGKTWQLAARQPGGFRSALAHIDHGRMVAVGPNGEDVTDDAGAHWKHTDSLNLNAVAILDIGTGWAVGPHGTVACFVNH